VAVACVPSKVYRFWEELREFCHHEKEIRPENKPPDCAKPLPNGGHGLSATDPLFNDLRQSILHPYWLIHGSKIYIYTSPISKANFLLIFSSGLAAKWPSPPSELRLHGLMPHPVQAALRESGFSTELLQVASWRIMKDNVDRLLASLRAALERKMPDAVVFQFMDNSVYFTLS
jgi:hypothetical protein